MFLHISYSTALEPSPEPIPAHQQGLKTSYYAEPRRVAQEPIPPIEQLPSIGLLELADLDKRLTKSLQRIQAMINGKNGKRNKTQEDYRLLQEYEKYKQDLRNYIPYFRQHYRKRKQQGQGIIFYNTPQELIKRLELLDGSLRAGNNGALNEYIQIVHQLRNIGIVSNN